MSDKHMAREMTPQERADLKEIARKLVLQINEITPMQWDKHDDKDQAIVLAALQATRRAALLECAKVVKAYISARDIAHATDEDQDAEEWRKTYRAYTEAADALDRLAQEG